MPGLDNPNQLGIIQACTIGAIAGSSAYVLALGIDMLGTLRVQASTNLTSMVALPLFGAVGGFIAGGCVQWLSPDAAGSGIPQVKAVLARVPIPMTMRIVAAKLIGGIAGLGSGLLMGREGPTVHIAAALASEVNKVVPTTGEQKRQLIAAGAGAGLAAAFNAPIAGVMFVLEELLKDISSKTIGVAVLACFVGAVVSRLLHANQQATLLELSANHANFLVRDIPWYVLLGVATGIGGALFNRTTIAMLNFNKYILKIPICLKVSLAGLITGLAIASMPDSFHDFAALRNTIVEGSAPPQEVALAGALFFALTAMAYGSGAPGGLFAPSLLMGASMGILVSHLELSLTGQSSHIALALAGMGGFFSSVARVPVTGMIIIFEMTRSFEMVLPLMVVSVVSSLVADRLYPDSIYDRLMDWSGIKPKTAPSTEVLLSTKTAKDVMASQFDSLAPEDLIAKGTALLKSSHHLGFPVQENGRLVGIVAINDFQSSELNAENQTIGSIMSHDPITITEQTTLARALFLFDTYKLAILPVVTDGTVVGVIRRTDLIHTLIAAQPELPVEGI